MRKIEPMEQLQKAFNALEIELIEETPIEDLRNELEESGVDCDAALASIEDLLSQYEEEEEEEETTPADTLGTIATNQEVQESEKAPSNCVKLPKENQETSSLPDTNQKHLITPEHQFAERYQVHSYLYRPHLPNRLRSRKGFRYIPYLEPIGEHLLEPNWYKPPEGIWYGILGGIQQATFLPDAGQWHLITPELQLTRDCQLSSGYLIREANVYIKNCWELEVHDSADLWRQSQHELSQDAFFMRLFKHAPKFQTLTPYENACWKLFHYGCKNIEYVSHAMGLDMAATCNLLQHIERKIHQEQAFQDLD